MKIFTNRDIYLTELQFIFESENFQSTIFFNEISSIKFCSKNSICFYDKKRMLVKNFEGIVVSNDKDIKCKYLIFSENPKYDFANILYYLKSQNLINFEYSSYIDKTAEIDKTAIIESGVKIGANTVIESYVVIKKGSEIGKNCIIGANSVVGREGFGIVNKNGQNNLRFPHFGRVIIYDNVEIGSFNTIDKGALENTIIEDYVMSDSQVHFGHGCSIGKNTVITAGNIISGSVNVGSNCWLGINSNLRDGITLGNNVFVGMGSNVVSNIKDNARVLGNPAKEF